MHLLMIFSALALACSVRYIKSHNICIKEKNWRLSLFFLVFPVLLLQMTAIAVLCMGTKGEMLGFKASPVSYLLALGFISYNVFLFVKLAYQGWLSARSINTYTQDEILGHRVTVIDSDFPYSALVGFWRPKLIVTTGILEVLDSEHLEAVLAHEQAHLDNNDTFWFFWLGWLKACTVWLPNTELLWQELLLLRELRADGIAAKVVDSIVLAESLLTVAQQVNNVSYPFEGSLTAALCDETQVSRLAERIDALLSETDFNQKSLSWQWLILTFLPLVTIPFHVV